MKIVKIKKGWPLDKIAGKPSQRIEKLPLPSHVALLPDKIPFIKPRLLAGEGDSVKIGSVLFEDKKNPDVKFLSPGGGTISGITYGPRRVIQEIVIELDATETAESFPTYTTSDLDQVDRNTLVSSLMSGGMWCFIRQLPFRAIADPDSTPNALWVTMESADPFQPAACVYLKNNSEYFELGIKALQRLASKVNITWYDNKAGKKKTSLRMTSHNLVSYMVNGGYPASDAGVVLFHTKKSAEENRDWFVDGQDVVQIGKFLKNGVYPVQRMVAFSDGTPENSCHLETRIGVRLNAFTIKTVRIRHPQWVVGGLFSGYTAEADHFLGLRESAVMIIEAAHESEFFGFLRPGLKKLSNSKTILSSVLPAPIAVNSDMHGEKRPCVNCGYCTAVCPVDIMPQYAYKSIYADEIEEALGHGLLDCVECGLCSFVCPSKIELADSLLQARRQYYKELNQVV